MYRYHFKCLPYGMHSTCKVFQREVTTIISGIQGKANPQDEANPEDDFVVWGKTLQEHDKRLKKIFLKIKESGLKLGKTKC